VSGLTIDTDRTPTGQLLRVAGELDLHSSPEVREALEAITLSAGELFVIDLSGITFCDSSGITALVSARNRALAAEAGIALAGVPDHLRRVLQMLGLSDVFPAFPDAGSAEDAWA
jgi:anti-sigma B factor antagonist